MRLFGVMERWAVAALLVSTVSGCGGDGSSGPATQFEVGEAVVLFEGDPFPGCGYELERPNLQNEPYITVNPSNRDHIVAMWQTRVARGFVAAVTFDGGATWETSMIPGISRCTGGEIGASDPWLAFATNGDLHSVALNFGPEATTSRILVNKSLDGGLTWSDPVTVGQLEPPRSEDKPSITADPFDECTVYVGWTRFDDDSSGALGGEVVFSRTTDCGGTWSDPQTLLRSDITGIGFQTVVLPDGTVLAFFKENVGALSIRHSFYVMRSTDRGETWPDEPVLVATARTAHPNLPDGEDEIRSMGSLFDVAVDRATGRLAAVWEDTFSDDTFVAKPKVAFTLSDDGGQTWSEPVRIDQTPLSEAELLNQAILPAVEISDDGTIGVTYYNFENDTPGMLPAETDYWFIHCHPDLADCTDGASWANAIRMTSESFDMSIAIPNARGLFLGDYMGLASSGSDFLTAFTVTRTTEEQNILFAPVFGR